MAAHHLAHLNIARLRAPLDDPLLAGFVALLAPVNELADRSPGFVWRLADEDGDATALRPFGDDVIVNLTVWESPEALRAYAYDSAHVHALRRRREWFLPMDEAAVVLWWIPAGTLPGLAEGAARLERLRRDGPGPEAFTLRAPHPPPAVSSTI